MSLLNPEASLVNQLPPPPPIDKYAGLKGKELFMHMMYHTPLEPGRQRIIRVEKSKEVAPLIVPIVHPDDEIRVHLNRIMADPVRRNKFYADFVVVQPKELMDIAERAPEIYKKECEIIASWNEHQDDMLIADMKHMDSLKGLLARECIDRTIPKRVEFYSTYTQGLESVYLGSVTFKTWEEGDEPLVTDDEESIVVPTIKRYHNADKDNQAIISKWVNDKRECISTIMYYQEGLDQERVDGVFHVDVISSPDIPLPPLPKKLIACHKFDLGVAMNNPLTGEGKLGAYRFSYTDPNTGKDIGDKLVRFILESETLRNHGLVVDFSTKESKEDEKEYTLILWLETRRYLRGDLYRHRDIGQTKDAKLVDGCWVPM
jgi:hypothetical protein